MGEIVDVVNDDDIVIGQELKSKCHKEKILHRGACIFAFKDDSFKEILIQKRSKTKNVKPLKLCTPGGHVRVGETYLEGAKREFFEEQFNSKVNKDLKFDELFKIKKFTDNDYEFITAFRTVCKGPFTPDPVEVESTFFENVNLTLKKINENPEDYLGSTRLLLEEYKKRYM